MFSEPSVERLEQFEAALAGDAAAWRGLAREERESVLLARELRVVLATEHQASVPDDVALRPVSARRAELLRPSRWDRARGVAVAAALAVTTLVAVIPSARAAVGEVVNHVRVALVRGDALSVEELRRRAPFPICVPTWLPDGLQVVGGNVLGTDQVVRISFDPGRTGGNSGVEGASGNGSDQPRPSAIVRFARAHNSAAGGGIHQMPGAERGRYTVPLDQAKNVQVHGRPAVFAAGAWEMTENGTRWNPGLAAGLLSWSGDGVANALTFSGLSLSREEVIRIAESCVP